MSTDGLETKDSGNKPIPTESGFDALNSQNVSTIKIPPFWNNRPDLWFIQVEAQFRAKGITASNTKYDHLVSALPPETMEVVADVVLNPPKDNRYDHLKKLLVERSTDSEERRLDVLLNKFELGDSKPSELFRKMECLASSNSLINTSLLKKLWLNKLPQYIQTCLIAIEKDHSQDEVFAIADKILDTASPSSSSPRIAAVSQPDNTLIELVKNLEKRLKRIEINSRVRDRSNSRNRVHFRRNSPARPNSTQMCYYHKKFGKEARKCKPPCNNNRREFQSKNELS